MVNNEERRVLTKWIRICVIIAAIPASIFFIACTVISGVLLVRLGWSAFYAVKTLKERGPDVVNSEEVVAIHRLFQKAMYDETTNVSDAVRETLLMLPLMSAGSTYRHVPLKLRAATRHPEVRAEGAPRRMTKSTMSPFEARSARTSG